MVTPLDYDQIRLVDCRFTEILFEERDVYFLKYQLFIHSFIHLFAQNS